MDQDPQELLLGILLGGALTDCFVDLKSGFLLKNKLYILVDTIFISLFHFGLPGNVFT